jgi:hypothetical protein
MAKRIIAATIIASAISSTSAHASWDTGVSLEYYSWKEEIPESANTPKESGPRYAVHLNWTKDGDAGLLFGYRGKIYFGQVNYDTFTQQTNTPVSTNSQYSGTAHEGQFYYRSDAGNYKMDYVGSIGADFWRRTIDSSLIEDYSILYLRGGLNLDQPGRRIGFHGGGGLKYPFWTAEDSHLDSYGYYSNPIITPGKDISLYAELGYRINDHFDVIGYYDSWRFKKSNIVTTTNAMGTWNIWQPKSSMDALGLMAMYLF